MTTPKSTAAIKDYPIKNRLQSSFIQYAMSVIRERALPDVRDGFKPVHRRIIWSMHDAGFTHNRGYRKCARVVGEVLGKYHPHGDKAIYDSLVRMAQDFSLTMPLIEGQGNFGTIDGDPPAAMRYTECRLEKLSDELVRDIDEETVSFVPNFDNTEKEPVVLPSAFPNLLVNGSMGIAVGMSTNIPPFNFSEVIDATVAMIDRIDEALLSHYSSIAEMLDNEDLIKPEELMEYIKGPDFPTGGEVHGTSGILDIIATGRGKVGVKSKIEIVESGKESKLPKILITEIPYQVNKADLVRQIREYRNKEPRIASVEDYSSLEGLLIEITLKAGSQPEAILNQLMKHTNVQSNFNAIMRALIGNNAKILSIPEILGHFLDHRIEIIEKRTKFRLRKAEDRVHVVDGLIEALKPGNLDKIIAIIRKTREIGDIRKKLAEEFIFTDKQVDSILSMQLRRLSALENEKLVAEQTELNTKIKEFKDLLSRRILVLQAIKNEVLELKENYGVPRKTRIISEGSADYIDLSQKSARDYVPEETVIYLLTSDGWVKSMPLKTYRAQKRGGKGIYALDIKDEDDIKELTVSSNHDDLLIFTKTPTHTKVYKIKVFEIPEMSRYSKGSSIRNLISLEKDEEVYTWIPVKNYENKSLLMATSQGMIKKTPLTGFKNVRSNGIIAINLREGDDLVGVSVTEEDDEVILGTRYGKAIRFKEADVRSVGRNSIGVIGIKLAEDDYVVGMAIVDEQCTLLVVNENGYGKRTGFSAYRLQKRAGKGLINVKITDKNGPVVGLVPVKNDDEMVFIASDGKLIRAPVKNIRVVGRATIGVRLMKLSESQKLVALSKIRMIDDESSAKDGNSQENEDQLDEDADNQVEEPETDDDIIEDEEIE
ncbi:MAG: DNA gyrase subunit A [Candidatus Odinarchaeota archaeon]